ncbi:MAG: TetR/AcrR family transcriptional repressor of mexJK operon [Hyphomicrobiaceae bacterium]|jgi:TetR/AcrR family transcriptional repressor of mexJK operon
MSSAANRAVSPRVEDTHRALLDAARSHITRYGYRRTSMQAVAREAGVSRAALYLHFENKEALFRSLANELQDQIYFAAKEAAGTDLSLTEKLAAIFQAKMGAWGALLDSTEHGSELTDENNRLCGDLSAKSGARFRRLLASVIRDANKAKQIDLRAVALSVDAAVGLVLAAVMGIEACAGGRLSPAVYRRELSRMLAVIVRGLR